MWLAAMLLAAMWFLFPVWCTFFDCSNETEWATCASSVKGISTKILKYDDKGMSISFLNEQSYVGVFKLEMGPQDPPIKDPNDKRQDRPQILEPKIASWRFFYL